MFWHADTCVADLGDNPVSIHVGSECNAFFMTRHGLQPNFLLDGVPGIEQEIDEYLFKTIRIGMDFG